MIENKSGRHDSNVRPPGPKPGALARLSYAPGFCTATLRNTKSVRCFPVRRSVRYLHRGDRSSQNQRATDRGTDDIGNHGRPSDSLNAASQQGSTLQSQRWDSNPQPPHYECGALPIKATLACREWFRFKALPRNVWSHSASKSVPVGGETLYRNEIPSHAPIIPHGGPGNPPNHCRRSSKSRLLEPQIGALGGNSSKTSSVRKPKKPYKTCVSNPHAAQEASPAIPPSQQAPDAASCKDFLHQSFEQRVALATRPTGNLGIRKPGNPSKSRIPVHSPGDARHLWVPTHRVKRSYRPGLRDDSQKADFTTPPSTRTAAPVVAEASGLDR